MTLPRLVLLGDGPWAVGALEAARATGHRVAGVVLRRHPTDPGLERAAGEHGIPVLQPNHVNGDASRAELAGLDAELALSVAYDQILSAATLELWPRGALNVHAGALPRYRGRNVLNWALINGEPEVGLTVHYMDPGIDTGDIVVQRMLPVGPDETYGELLARVVAAVPAAVTEALALEATGNPPRRRQEPGAGTYFPGRGTGDEWIDWADSSRNIHNLVRAIARPGPGARTTLDGEPVIVWSTACNDAWPGYRATPGAVVGAPPGGGRLVKTGDSVLLVREAELEGHAPTMPDWPVGTRLGADPRQVIATLEARIRELEEALHAREEGLHGL